MISTRRIIEQTGSIAEGSYFISGILFAGWSPMLAAAGYWLEETITFAVTAFILIGIKFKTGKKIFLSRYLPLYGIFLFVHTIFFLVLAAVTSKTDKAGEVIFESFLRFIIGSSYHLPADFKIEIALITLIVSGCVVYTAYFRVKNSNADPGLLINRSFSAIIVPHFLLIIGLGAIIITGAPSALMAALVAVKVLIDMTGVFDKGSPIISPDEK